MQEATAIMDRLGVEYEVEVVSAHRTPDKLMSFSAAAADRGFEVIIAGAGGAAHLPGMVASKTRLPVLGVPVQSKALSGVDSLYSIVQMPRGVAVGSLAIGGAGAFNAGLLACQMLANNDPELARRVEDFRSEQTQTILDNPDPRQN
jgi:5-(carboxyamino)imidazole ribonucleotide mutase